MTKARHLKRFDAFRIDVPCEVISVTPVDKKNVLIRIGLLDTRSLEFTDRGMQLEFICPKGRISQAWRGDHWEGDPEHEPVPDPAGGDLELV